MIKICFCAAAMMIGAAIGATAPASWGGDTSRTAAMTAGTTAQTTMVALAYRPFQGD